MSDKALPEGVPPSNDKAELTGERDFIAPNVATPQFAHSAVPGRDARGLHASVLNIRGGERFVEDPADDEDNDGEDGNSRPKAQPVNGVHAPGAFAIIIAIVLVLAAIASFVLAQNREPLPLCSEQPSWNQYNCRTR